MSSFRIDVPEAKPWVRAEWDQAGAMFAVTCQHCGGMDYAFVPFLRREPTAPAEWIRHHNCCQAREAVSA